MPARVQTAPVTLRRKRATPSSARPNGVAGPVHMHDDIASMAREQVDARNELRRARIEQAAYFRAEKRDFAPGHELEDWLAAEAQIDSETGTLQ